ncbi:hypothetical protein D3H65_01790 [Paraflavitalea soli]|uniref:Uncharacterized protein n=1 Tax=Paraflavitalea soli TaxID=2315862 RepID=A0A3B7MGR1_9BACT|nr:hypothetical protein [Paraflavitalea soli]AXY72777.1 hypothetical protein D3H65_01790 [Paraflavitalea soli]
MMATNLTIGFRTQDQELDELIRMEFEKEKMQYINQFTTESLITIILSATKESVEKLLRFFKRHRESFSVAFVRTDDGRTLSLFEYADKDLHRLAGTGLQ